MSNNSVSERTSIGKRANRGGLVAALLAIVLVVMVLGVANAETRVATAASSGRTAIETAAAGATPAQTQIAAARVDGPKAPPSADARPRALARFSGTEPLWLLLLGSTLFAVASCINVFGSRQRAE